MTAEAARKAAQKNEEKMKEKEGESGSLACSRLLSFSLPLYFSLSFQPSLSLPLSLSLFSLFLQLNVSVTQLNLLDSIVVQKAESVYQFIGFGSLSVAL